MRINKVNASLTLSNLVLAGSVTESERLSKDIYAGSNTVVVKELARPVRSLAAFALVLVSLKLLGSGRCFALAKSSMRLALPHRWLLTAFGAAAWLIARGELKELGSFRG